MVFEALPLFRGKLHPFPVLEAVGVLRTEGHPPWLRWSTFGAGNMSLEFDGVGARVRYGVHEGMGQPQTAVVILRDFGDDKAAVLPTFIGAVDKLCPEIFQWLLFLLD